MSQQQLVLQPLGLVTEPNKLGQIPAGALSIMTDCVERSPGVIENIQAWQTKVTVDTAAASTTAMFGVPMDNNRVVVIYNKSSNRWFYRWYDLVTGAAVYAEQELSITSGGSTYQQSFPVYVEQPGFCVVRHGTQVFVNAFSTVLVWDDPTGATLASSLVRPAGLQRLQVVVVSALAGVGIALPVNSYATYVAINTRMINGRKVVSAPSVAISQRNAAINAINVTLSIKLRLGDQQVGDVIELYRTPTKPGGVTASFQKFQAGEEAAAEYRRVTSYTLKTADLAGSLVIGVDDACPDTSLGEALYTNQAINGSGAAAEPPPAVELLSSYKGYLFGFSITRAPSITLRPVGLWGGFDSTQTAETVKSGFGTVFGDADLVGASYSSGSTTINVSPTSQLQFLAVGMAAVGTNFNALITAIGASSFTIGAPTTGASAGDTWEVVDMFDWNSGFGTSQNRSWPGLVNGMQFSSDVIGLRAQSLKLPPFTSSQFVIAAIGMNTQPTDGFEVYHRFLQDSRPQLGVRSSKGSSWDPQIVNNLSGTYTLTSEEKRPRVFVNSEQDEPEAWPFVNEDSFSRGTPCAVASTADAQVLFYTDGIWSLSGTGGSAAKGFDWRADPIATGITPIGSQVVAVLLDKVYAMTSEGLIVIARSGFTNITQGRVHDQLATPPWNNGPFNSGTASGGADLTGSSFLVEDEEHDEILLREPSATNGKLWIYNTHTDRLSQTTVQAQPVSAFYSRALRSPVVIGREGGVGTDWTLKAQTGAYGNFGLTYATIYADNPFAQRHWQTLNVSAETAGATITPTFNGVAGSARTLDTDGRAGFEVPRNAPAIGNTMQVGLSVATSVRTKLNGFAIDYRDHTERRKTR
jgi:hypothetical protein